MNIKEVFKRHPNGFSIRISDMTLFKGKSGYAVGLTDNRCTENRLESDFNFLLKVAWKLSSDKDKTFIGGWYNKNEKAFYLDVSILIEGFSDAVSTGKIFKQKSIYDFNLKKCIDI